MKLNSLRASLYLVGFLSPLFAFAVTTAPAPARVKDLNSWVGKPVSELLNHPKFGPSPTDQIKIGEDTVLTYRQIFGLSGNVQNKLSVNIFCRRNFVYGENLLKVNVIKSITEEGTCDDTVEYLPLSKSKK